MKKIIRPEGPAKKITLLRYCPKKIFRPRHKSQAPPRISNGPCLIQCLSYHYFTSVTSKSKPESVYSNFHVFNLSSPYEWYTAILFDFICLSSMWGKRQTTGIIMAFAQPKMRQSILCISFLFLTNNYIHKIWMIWHVFLVSKCKYAH